MSLSLIKMADLNLTGLRVLIREDLNVPLKNGRITSDARILAALPTIKLAMDAGAKVMVMSHLGRPVEGELNDEFSMRPVADYLAELLTCKVPLISDRKTITEDSIHNGDVVLLENVRFNIGEKKDSEALSRDYASLCDVFVMDAFGTAHRAEASTHGVAKFAKIASAGPLLVSELDALTKALAAPARPMVAIVGGSKVSSKLTVLESLSGIVDQLIVGGGIANTFLAASGSNVGKSLCEHDLLDDAKKLMKKTYIPLPVDVVTGKEFSEVAPASIKLATAIEDDDMVFDIGPQSSANIAEILKNAKTILWNGPVGVFEFDQFGQGTKALSLAIAQSDAYSLAGGGDTIAAIDKYNIKDKISYISTGGGAFLEYVEGKVLPAVAILEQRAQQKTR